MLLDVCLGTRTAWKILLLMSEAPGKVLTRKQIKEHTKIGNKVLVKFLTLLEKFDVVQTTKKGRIHQYKLNVANKFTKAVIDIIQNEHRQLNAMYFGSLIVVREFVYELTNLNLSNIEKIILFGSVAKHTATVHSDIDIAIVTKENVTPKEQLLHTHICGQLEKRFGKTIQIHYFTKEEFEKTDNKLVREISTDGLILVGVDS
ncbi:MAG TPA: nucleotidyltransferase domain-containing protein [Candidatus Nanoarchaeia archaeon]|nr:nucleotidyltransferase domain-containing protein [Candidatus Nanoarchaeia archaeon]